jgi:hypothetical protein
VTVLRNEERKERREQSVYCLLLFVLSYRVFLPCQRYFDRANIGWSGASALFAWLSHQLLRADVNGFDFDIWQESASADFDYVYCSAYGSSSCFDFNFVCSAVEEGYACQDIVHCRLSTNQNCVAFARL